MILAIELFYLQCTQEVRVICIKDMVYRLISNNHYSIIINGKAEGFFKATRGLKQGDPLSPALFIIMAEVLSRGLYNMMESGDMQSFKQPLGTQYISHLSFADDILIFCNAGKKTLRNMMEFIRSYEKWSGQLLNTNKCNFYVGNKATTQVINNIKQCTCFNKQDLPIKYLGCPIFAGRAKISYFDELVDSIRNKMQGWQTNFLNQAGKLILIMHVLQSIPIHIFAAINPRKAVIKEIDKILASCFWKNKESKHHWIKWEVCCSTKESGGLGIKKMEDIIKVQSFKLFWKLHTEDTLWTRFMRIKYQKEMQDMNRTGQTSKTWKRIKEISAEAEQYLDRSSSVIKWKLSSNSKFNSKETWKEIKTEGVNTNGAFIWNKLIPKKISIFLWKLIHGKLPVELNIRKVGIQIASKCHCCKACKEEDQNHLFSKSEIAQETWNIIFGKLQLQGRRDDLIAGLKNWWLRCKPNSTKAGIFHVVPAIVLWEIWKNRCSAIFEDSTMKTTEIMKQIKISISKIIKLRKSYKISEGVVQILTQIVQDDDD